MWRPYCGCLVLVAHPIAIHKVVTAATFQWKVMLDVLTTIIVDSTNKGLKVRNSLPERNITAHGTIWIEVQEPDSSDSNNCNWVSSSDATSLIWGNVILKSCLQSSLNFRLESILEPVTCDC